MSSNKIKLAADLLRKGELVAFPTETVYGLGADATNHTAVKKIYLAKGRPAHNPLIVHTYGVDKVEKFVEISRNSRVYTQFTRLSILWPGPLTIVFPKKKECICDTATAGQQSVGIRIPNHGLALELLRVVDTPIAAPSANQSEYVSSTEAEHVRSCFGGNIHLLDGGKTPLGLESTIIKLTEDGAPELLRYGFIEKDQLSEVLAEEVIDRVSKHRATVPTSPGQLKKHYSPRTPLRFITDEEELFREAQEKELHMGLISFAKREIPENQNIALRVLSEAGDREECARNLYSTLRELDKFQLDLICIERPKQGRLYEALLDRLQRAVV